jgi:hypothetical protein
VGIEACNNSHYCARELTALGHDVKLMPAKYVKPYVKRGKNDAADAEAICEAVTRFAQKASWPAAHDKPHRKAGHMAASTSEMQSFEKPLANGGPSTHGPVAAENQRLERRSVSGGRSSRYVWRITVDLVA